VVFQDIFLLKARTKDIKRCQLKECSIFQSFQDYRDCMLLWIQQDKWDGIMRTNGMIAYYDILVMGKLGNTSIMYIPILKLTHNILDWVYFLMGLHHMCKLQYPHFLTPYNLPPKICMTKPYMFLTCLIPSLTNTTKKIDVYLQPLIDNLQLLWNEGVFTYDISTKENFVMRACLMWTINDFSAYEMLFGWRTKDKLARLYCIQDTKAFQLRQWSKTS